MVRDQAISASRVILAIAATRVRVLTPSVAAMLVAQFRGYMGVHPTFSWGYARYVMDGREVNVVAMQR